MSGPFVCLLTSHHLWMYIFYSTKTNLTRLISPDLEMFGSSCVFSYLTFITFSALWSFGRHGCEVHIVTVTLLCISLLSNINN